MLKTEPKARYVLKVCNSTPCHFSRSEEIAQILKEELGVGIGETTEDGVFAYHYIPCVGACDIGPVIKVKDTVYGNLDRRKIRQLLADLRSGTRRSSDLTQSIIGGEHLHGNTRICFIKTRGQNGPCICP